jgi:hypothetical protein
MERAGIMSEEKIKFWRSKTGSEVDIIYEDRLAFEVKFEARLLRETRYKQFRESYPHIDLHIVSFSGLSHHSFPVWEAWLI